MTTPNVLFVDDDFTRVSTFTEFARDLCGIPLPFRVFFAYSYQQAVKELSARGYDLVFLDHDLGVQDQMCDPSKPTFYKTGTDIAKFMVGLTYPPPKLTVLHTFNPAGAHSMKAIFNDAGFKNVYVPFGYPYPIAVTEILKGQ